MLPVGRSLGSLGLGVQGVGVQDLGLLFCVFAECYIEASTTSISFAFGHSYG